MGANLHEHFRSLFLADNFVTLGTDLFSIPPNEQKLSEAFGRYDQLLLMLRVNFRISEAKARFLIPESDFQKLTIQDLCLRLPGTVFENFKKLVEMHIPEKNVSNVEIRNLYVLQEDIRTIWLKNLSKEMLTKIYINYFETDNQENWKDLHISVSAPYLTGEHKWRYNLFLEVAHQYKAKVKTFLSIHRGKIDHANLRSSDFQYIDGIDLTASMFEDQRTLNALKQDSLERIFDFASRNGKELRIHAFEASNTGPFYKILKNVLKTYKRPIQIRIGHISHLTKEWLVLMKKNPHLQISFDVNASSNFWLQSRKTSELIEIIKMIHSFGFSTNLGSDGRGILPLSSYREQTKILDSEGYNYQCVKFYLK